MRESISREVCCRKGDPFQGPKLGSCLTLGNELSKETQMLMKQATLLRRAESRRMRDPRRAAQSQALW